MTYYIYMHMHTHMPVHRYAYTLALCLSSTIYFLAGTRSITSCVCDMVLIMWWFSKHMHLHLCRYMFIMLCASPPPLVRSPRSALLYWIGVVRSPRSALLYWIGGYKIVTGGNGVHFSFGMYLYTSKTIDKNKHCHQRRTSKLQLVFSAVDTRNLPAW